MPTLPPEVIRSLSALVPLFEEENAKEKLFATPSLSAVIAPCSQFC